MVEMEKKWLGVVDKCLDSDELATPNNLGLGSFWGLFLIAGVAAVIVLIIYVCRSLFCAPAEPVAPAPAPAPAAVRENVDAANEGGN